MEAPAATEKRKSGDLHPTDAGRVFHSYHLRGGVRHEYWTTPEKLEESRRKSKESMARRRAENPDAEREKWRKWRKANPEKIRGYHVRWKATNSDKVRESKARWSKANPEKVKANNTRWSAANREKIRAWHVRRFTANPEAIRERNRRWLKENPTKARETSRIWNAKNPEKVRIYYARWRAANPEKVRAFTAKRRAGKRNALHPDHSTEIEAVLFQSAARLRECLGIDFHLDHAIPLARGGTHHHTNLRVLPGRFNVRKRDRLDCELPSNLQTAIKQWSPYLN